MSSTAPGFHAFNNYPKVNNQSINAGQANGSMEIRGDPYKIFLYVTCCPTSVNIEFTKGPGDQRWHMQICPACHMLSISVVIETILRHGDQWWLVHIYWYVTCCPFSLIMQVLEHFTNYHYLLAMWVMHNTLLSWYLVSIP